MLYTFTCSPHQSMSHVWTPPWINKNYARVTRSGPRRSRFLYQKEWFHFSCTWHCCTTLHRNKTWSPKTMKSPGWPWAALYDSFPSMIFPGNIKWMITETGEGTGVSRPVWFVPQYDFSWQYQVNDYRDKRGNRCEPPCMIRSPVWFFLVISSESLQRQEREPEWAGAGTKVNPLEPIKQVLEICSLTSNKLLRSPLLRNTNQHKNFTTYCVSKRCCLFLFFACSYYSFKKYFRYLVNDTVWNKT